MASRIIPTKVTAPRKPRQRKESHLQYLRNLGQCIACRAFGVIEAAHLRLGNHKYAKAITGAGTKPHDMWCLPLCPRCHRNQHSSGEHIFWQSWGVNPFVSALALWAHTGDHEAGLQIIRSAR